MVTNTHTAVGAAQEMGQVLALQLACFKGVVRPVNQLSQTSARRLMPGMKIDLLDIVRL